MCLWVSLGITCLEYIWGTMGNQIGQIKVSLSRLFRLHKGTAYFSASLLIGLFPTAEGSSNQEKGSVVTYMRLLFVAAFENRALGFSPFRKRLNSKKCCREAFIYLHLQAWNSPWSCRLVKYNLAHFSQSSSPHLHLHHHHQPRAYLPLATPADGLNDHGYHYPHRKICLILKIQPGPFDGTCFPIMELPSNYTDFQKWTAFPNKKIVIYQSNGIVGWPEE